MTTLFGFPSSTPAALAAASALVASASHAQIIDLDAIGDCGLTGDHGVQRTVGPGTYRMQPVHAKFMAWFRWPDVPIGCDDDGGNCQFGWTVYWDVRRADGTLQRFPDAVVPRSDRWETPELAYKNAASALLVLNAQETVTFFIYDSPCNDNIGGVSLDLFLVCIADFNGDKTVNSTDVSAFINAWFDDLNGGSFVTDWDGNGVVNSTDVSDFINQWFLDQAAGCG